MQLARQLLVPPGQQEQQLLETARGRVRRDAVEGDIAGLLQHAETRAELTIAWLRLAGAVLLLSLVYGVYGATGMDWGGRYFPPVTITLGFGLTSLAAFALIATRRYRPELGWLFALADVAIGVLALAESAHRNGLSGNGLFLSASAWAGPLILAFNVLRFRPMIVAAAAATYVVGGLLVATCAGIFVVAPPLAEIGRFANLAPNVVRLALLVLTGLSLALVVSRTRHLLVRALEEQRERSMLTRFLPAEIIAEFLRGGSKLSEGTNMPCTILFVDLRGSTRLAERMAPCQFADFLARFRRRVTRSVAAHGGLVDKFVGDGAMIVFGPPEPRPDDARRALGCAKDLVCRMAEWNAHRVAQSALSIAIGIHSGTCFCGVVGEGSRVEFTVVGDTVNVAARLEQIAKLEHADIVASADTLARAGEVPGHEWTRREIQDLRGHAAPVDIFCLR